MLEDGIKPKPHWCMHSTNLLVHGLPFHLNLKLTSFPTQWVVNQRVGQKHCFACTFCSGHLLLLNKSTSKLSVTLQQRGQRAHGPCRSGVWTWHRGMACPCSMMCGVSDWETRKTGNSSIARNWNFPEASSPLDPGIAGLLTWRAAQGSMGKLRGLRWCRLRNPSTFAKLYGLNKPPGFKGRETRSYLLRGGMPKNLQPCFKTSTSFLSF